jgi:hypothetical protein
MLAIITKDGHEIQWHVGTPVPKMWGKGGSEYQAMERIYMLQADGDELAHVRKAFMSKVTIFAPAGEEPASVTFDVPTIPLTSGPVVRWYGDLAKTIFLNL